MQQFAALGYIEDPGLETEEAAESADIEAKYNVSRTYLWKRDVVFCFDVGGLRCFFLSRPGSPM